MVQAEGELEAIDGTAMDVEAQETGTRQIERPRLLFLDERVQRPLLLLVVERRQVALFDDHVRVRVYELQRLAEAAQLERAAQDRVTVERLGDDPPQRGPLELHAHVIAEDVVVDRRRRLVRAVKQHPGLQRRQRVGVDDVRRQPVAIGVRDQRKGFERRHGVFDRGTRRRERRDRRVLEDVTDGTFHAGGLRVGHDLQREDRVAAALEGVVVDADAIDAQHTRPDAAQQFFRARARRRVGADALPVCAARIWQRSTIDLAAHRPRQPIEDHDGRRDHVVGKPRRQRRPNRRRVGGCRSTRDDIRDEAHRSIRRVAACHDRGVADGGHPAERRLDLTRLDAIAADLHLLIEAAEIFERAIAAPPHAIARAVQPLAAVAERIGHEARRRQRWLIQIAARDAGAADQ